MKTTASWAADLDVDEEAEWALRAQWVRVCVEDALAGTKCTAEVMDDLWFSLRRDQRAALQTMALVMNRARRAAQTPDLDGDWSLDRKWRCSRKWQSDDSDSSSDDGAGNEGGGAVGAAPACSARGDGGGGGSNGGGNWRSPGSMERYTSVQHVLRSADCGLFAM